MRNVDLDNDGKINLKEFKAEFIRELSAVARPASAHQEGESQQATSTIPNEMKENKSQSKSNNFLQVEKKVSVEVSTTSVGSARRRKARQVGSGLVTSVCV